MIRLDATLLDVVDDCVFTAEIDNGHRFVAVAKLRSAGRGGGLRPADRVVVEFSPFEMSRAHVVPNEVSDEGSKFSEADV